MKALYAGFCWLLVAGCHSAPVSLLNVRVGFKTHLTAAKATGLPPETPPPALFRVVQYPSKVGALAAYMSPDPGDGRRHPAVMWITGGDCNSIGDVWTPRPPENDQSAAAFRQAGLVLLFPSLRGGNDNPGRKEGFLGEVNDVLAATAFLKAQPYVDPERIYLGGHSTGGTLAMLVAESSPQYRAVFAFGPVADVAGYGPDSGFLPFEVSRTEEIRLRSPGYWLKLVQSPLWVIEGTEESNIESLHAMKAANRNPLTHFLAAAGETHFSVLAPANQLLAQKIRADSTATSRIQITETELRGQFERQ